MAISV
jgi:hypothetical protein